MTRAEVLSLATGNAEARAQRIPLLVIDGINCFANFTRAFYLSAALGCWTGAGIRVCSGVPSIRTLREAMVVAIHAAAKNKAQYLPATGPIGRRQEPAWHDPNVLIQCAQAASLSNRDDVVSAFSPFPKCVTDWSCVRNFFAHRNGDTHAAATTVLAQNGLVSRGGITELLVQPGIHGARPLLWDWCEEIELVCEYLCF